MKSIRDYPNCFVCGDNNHRGLKISFLYEEGKAKAEYMPTKEFEGYENILHGGIISTLLDEVMIHSILAKGILTITTQMEVKFKKPARIGEKLLLEGKIKEDKGRIILTEGKIFKKDGTIIAVATGKFFRTEGDTKKPLENQKK